MTEHEKQFSENSGELPTNLKNQKQFKDQQTDKRIHEHLTDENDIISEKDIQNVITDVEENSGEEPATEIADNEQLPDSDIDVNKDDNAAEEKPATGIETPWNILGS